MQVGRVGIRQMLFPGFRPFPLQGRRQPQAGAVLTRPINRGPWMGQVDQSKKPLSIPYADAQKMLSSAEGIIASYPACDLPVIGRFRAYVKGGQQAANLELSAAESAELDQFALCADTKGQKGGKSADQTTGYVIAGVAAAALIGLLVWNA